MKVRIVVVFTLVLGLIIQCQNVNRSPLSQEKNVLGGVLQICCTEPMTGYYRDGLCRTGDDDLGMHAICTVMTPAFLEYSSAQGNDLSTPIPETGFPGLKPGDQWCLGVQRWKEAEFAGMAPKVVLKATHQWVLMKVHIDLLREYEVFD